jgi:diguanylate cyclase (GGDEF)-like protein
LQIDDGPQELIALSTVLSQQGYTVQHARHNTVSLETIQSLRPDLILLEVGVSGVDGYALGEKLKQDPRTAGVPIIFISTSTRALDQLRAFALEGVDYITTPFQAEEVLVRVKHQLTIRHLQDQLQHQNRLLQEANVRLEREINKRQQVAADFQAVNQELRRLAAIDGLTQLANRRNFDTVLAEQWQLAEQQQAPLSLILLDIDYFKFFNDTYGHLAGDDCLCQVAQAVHHVVHVNCPEVDFLVARYGGEELAVVLSRMPLQQACTLASTIHRHIQSLGIAHHASPVAAILTVSIGVATVIPTPEITIEQLIAESDAFLYEAKQEGRNRVRGCGESCI